MVCIFFFLTYLGGGRGGNKQPRMTCPKIKKFVTADSQRYVSGCGSGHYGGCTRSNTAPTGAVLPRKGASTIPAGLGTV